MKSKDVVENPGLEPRMGHFCHIKKNNRESLEIEPSNERLSSP